MLIVAVVLIHDKGTTANRQQITTLNNNLIPTQINVTDDSGNILGTTTIYTLKNVAISHECRVFQILPQGVAEPTNLYLINSRKMLWGNDQPSHNRRFFNCALRWCVSYGADVVIYIKDISLATMSDLQTAAQELSDTKLLVDRTWGYLVGPKALRVIGYLNENMTFTNAVTDYKNRITSGGFVSG